MRTAVARQPRVERAYAAGTRVIVSDPDSRDCFRAGEEGVVRECLEHRVTEDERRKRKASVCWLHVVDFDTDVVVEKNGKKVNLGRVPVFVMGHEIEAVDG